MHASSLSEWEKNRSSCQSSTAAPNTKGWCCSSAEPANQRLCHQHLTRHELLTPVFRSIFLPSCKLDSPKFCISDPFSWILKYLTAPLSYYTTVLWELHFTAFQPTLFFFFFLVSWQYLQVIFITKEWSPSLVAGSGLGMSWLSVLFSEGEHLCMSL